MSLLKSKSKDKKKRDKEIKEKLELDQKTFDDIQMTFRLMDKDQSGSISHAEFKEVIAKLNCHSTDREIHEMLLNADKDQSGAIEFEEFATMMAIKHKEKSALDKEMKELFKSFDTNRDGFLGRKEIQKGFEALQGRMLTDEEADEIIRTADRNDDGVLDEKEFIAYVYDNQ